MTLSEFLLARIAEDEAAAREVASYMNDGELIQIHLTRREGDESRSKTLRPYDPVRVLAECEAKRRILDYHASRLANESPGAFADTTMLLLVLPYREHPDCRNVWKI